MSPIADAAVFGRGIAFAPRLGAEGRVEWSTGEASIRDSIRVTLLTEPGERVRLPAFGAGLRAFLFEPNTASTHRMIEERITFALARWEPRITVDDVVVQRNEADHRQAIVEIRYRLVATGTEAELDLAIPVGVDRG